MLSKRVGFTGNLAVSIVAVAFLSFAENLCGGECPQSWDVLITTVQGGPPSPAPIQGSGHLHQAIIYATAQTTFNILDNGSSSTPTSSMFSLTVPAITVIPIMLDVRFEHGINPSTNDDAVVTVNLYYKMDQDLDCCPSAESCEDGIACTDDSFDGETCVSVANDANCDDSIDCTVDACDPALGCTYTPDDSVCDDGDDCTKDRCIPGIGCVYTLEGDYDHDDDIDLVDFGSFATCFGAML